MRWNFDIYFSGKKLQKIEGRNQYLLMVSPIKFFRKPHLLSNFVFGLSWCIVRKDSVTIFRMKWSNLRSSFGSIPFFLLILNSVYFFYFFEVNMNKWLLVLFFGFYKISRDVFSHFTWNCDFSIMNYLRKFRRKKIITL